MILIPFDPMKSADQEFKIQLGDQIAQIRLLWNVRSESWSMTLSGDFGTLTGLKLVPDWPLLREREATTTFVGDFIMRSLTAATTGGRIEYGDLGVRWGLCWMTAEEKTAWEAYYGLG